jgi:hypothetical protein
MSDLGWTRLADLLDAGYCIEADRSNRRFLYLRHMDGNSPNIGLWSSGEIEPMGNPLWPTHLHYEHSIGRRQGTRFQQFLALRDYPTRWEQRSYHICKLIELSATACYVARLIGAIRWHLFESGR